MRKFFIILTILLIPVKCFADVTTEILSKQKAPNGDLWICTQYKIDGAEVVSSYPKVDGKSCFMTRYNAYHLAGLNNQQIIQMIDDDVKEHAETLVRDKYSEKVVEQVVTEINVVGRTSTVKDAKVKVDTDKNGQLDKEYTVNTDGTKTEKDIVEPVNP